MDIKCKKIICRFNDCQTCKAKGILVGRQLNCKTFEKMTKKPHKLQDVSKHMFEIAPEVVPFKHCRALSIDCVASCLFNVGGKCCANGITVIEGSKTGICSTNLKK